MKKIAIISLSLFFLACTKEIDSSKMGINNSSNSSNAIAMSANANGVAMGGDVTVVDKTTSNASSEGSINNDLLSPKDGNATKGNGVNVPNNKIDLNLPNNGDSKINIGNSPNAGGTSSGLDGNSPEGVACSKEAETLWHASAEYQQFNSIAKDGGELYFYHSYISQAKFAEIILKNCGQFLNSKEKQFLQSSMETALFTASELKKNAVTIIY